MRERDLVLDAVALSALLDERKPDHVYARRVLSDGVARRAKDVQQLDSALFLVPSITLYEVRRGLLKVGARRRVRALDRFLRAYGSIEDFDEGAAKVAARLWAERSKAGRPAGERDLLILATAVVAEADVVTRDTGFPTTTGVSVLTWEQVAAELDQA